MKTIFGIIFLFFLFFFTHSMNTIITELDKLQERLEIPIEEPIVEYEEIIVHEAPKTKQQIKEIRENGIDTIEIHMERITNLDREQFKQALSTDLFGTDKSCLGYYTKYHYMIFFDGEILKTRCEYEEGSDINKLSVLYVGDGDQVSNAQYRAVNSFLIETSSRLGAKVDNLSSMDIKKLLWDGKHIEMDFTRYYSVMPDQDVYYAGQSYEDSKEMNCSGSCLVAAGGKLLPSMANKVGACPPYIPMYTTISINGSLWKCYDRGGAIKGDRFDNRCGIGAQALTANGGLSSKCFSQTQYGNIEM